ncbi:hypothetical protein N431DRAFT_438968 [Stipitochalara longipes BDJ]|nr:hypothetical protein N431DRAFT_438968 [Stipitochalara longipes BDJ]
MSSCEPSRVPPAPPPSPVHEVARPHNEITATHVIELTWATRLKHSDRTFPTSEERVQELLRTTDNPDTIRHICRLYPFRDQNIPHVVLSGRWDPCLDSFLISLHGNPDAEQEILQLSSEKKAKKLLRLLDPLQEKQSTMWTWNPPDLSREPHDIAEAIYKVVSPTFFQITLREWLVYLDGEKVAVVIRLLLAFKSISEHIKQLPPKKYKMLEKILHSGDPLGCCIFCHDPPEQILRAFFGPAEKALKCRNASGLMEELVLLNECYIAMAECAGGNWHNLWTDRENSNALERSTTDAQNRQGGECFVFYALLVMYNVVAVKLLSIYQSWRIHGSRNNQVLDVEKCQQNHEARPLGSINSSKVQLLEKCW